MSVDSVNQFYQEVMQEPALLQQFQAAPDQESLANMAMKVSQQKGYSFTIDEVEQALAAQNTVSEAGELSDEQLETVAGGKGEQKTSVDITIYSGEASWKC
ncbi:MAG TPA: Nif11-like leader peptide family natural product precursor [Cyanobacteria bacterium UBA8553]|nr:Nif11-like leader peptide family natural product precursor [Cyanobacteria bacterium UBA8553]